MSDASRSFSNKLRELTSELRALDHKLKASAEVSGPALREFRQALDNVRLTAWTVSELQNARETNKDTEAVGSFLTAERLRRFRQMVDDLRSDLDHDGGTWPSQSIEDLQNAISELRERLGLLSYSRAGQGSRK